MSNRPDPSSASGRLDPELGQVLQLRIERRTSQKATLLQHYSDSGERRSFTFQLSLSLCAAWMRTAVTTTSVRKRRCYLELLLPLTVGETASTPKVGLPEEEEEPLALTEISSAAQGEQYGCNSN